MVIALPTPMLLTENKRHTLGMTGWIYEIKWDGWRLVAGVKDGAARLVTRKGIDVTKRFPEVANALRDRFEDGVVFDGELCVLDDLGRSDFDRLQERALRSRWKPGLDTVVFCSFDLLAVDRQQLLEEPVEIRKARLAKLLTPALPSVMYVGHFNAEHGRQIYEHAVELKLEGLVAKRLGSIYRPGARSLDWVKVKRPGAVPAERFRR